MKLLVVTNLLPSVLCRRVRAAVFTSESLSSRSRPSDSSPCEFLQPTDQGESDPARLRTRVQSSRKRVDLSLEGSLVSLMKSALVEYWSSDLCTTCGLVRGRLVLLHARILGISLPQTCHRDEGRLNHVRYRRSTDGLLVEPKGAGHNKPTENFTWEKSVMFSLWT
jgi:hypothetical protein